MDDRYQPLASDWGRQYYDPSHPLYISTASEDALEHLSSSEHTAQLGPWGKRVLYVAFALVAAYFGLVLIFGAH